MKIYYTTTEYQAGKHRIVKVLYDDEVFKFDEGTLAPHGILTIAELDPVNKPLCLDLKRTEGKVDSVGENKYYVNANGQLMEKAGWAIEVPSLI